MNNLYKRLNNLRKNENVYLSTILQKSGYRERAILQNLQNFYIKEKNDDYCVICFYDKNGNSFDYEAKRQIICG